MPETATADMEQAMEDIRADIEEINGRLEEMAKEAAEKKQNDEPVPPEDQQAFAQIQDIKADVKKQLGIFEEKADAWDGTEFEFLRFMEVGDGFQLRDELSKDTDIARSDIPQREYGGRIEGKQFAKQVVSTPDGAPDNPNELPQPIGMWLQEKIRTCVVPESVEDELGNSDLLEAAEAYMDTE